MKNFAILILMVVLSQLSFSQTMTIHKQDGTSVDIQLSEVDSITFIASPGSPGSAPAGVVATAGNGQVMISWNAVSGATSYNIYRLTTPGVTKINGTQITNATSPYADTGRTNGTKYYYVVTAVSTDGESSESAEVSATPEIPTDTGVGGTATYFVSNGITYAVHTFTLSTNFHPPTNLTHARVLLVGGGGTGGDNTIAITASGGGGGGGEVKDTDIAISGTMAVVVGTAGTSSSFGGQTAQPGLGGSDGTETPPNGGGGGFSGNGHDGGLGHAFCAGGGGGNGGYGLDGVPDTYNPNGGNGGSGSTSDITGVSQYYGGGGGGGTWVYYGGQGGKGGAGGGGDATHAGTANTGGGGGGGSWEGGYSEFVGRAGGSGIVIVSYPIQ